MSRILLTLAVVVTLVTPAYAQTIALGAGTAPCATITNLYRRHPEDKPMVDTMVGAWASGFMSSGNFARRVQGKDSRDLGAMTLDAQILYLRRWCKARPDKQLMSAVLELFALLPSNGDADADMVADEPR